MMEIEQILRIAAIVIASLLVFTNINIKSVLDKIKNIVVFKRQNIIPETINKKENLDFLEIIDLWYKLKNKCEEHNLISAVEQLDKVFPLLNSGDDND